jgi:hypothetical protein
MRFGARAFAVASWLALATPACYAPDIASGTLACSTKGICPSGFMCLETDGRCWKPEEVVSGSLRCGPSNSCPAGFMCQTSDKTCWRTGEEPATAPHGDNIGLDFEGHWLFMPPAENVTSCSDGSRVPRSLENDWVDITAGGKGDFEASYYCDWDLVVSGNGMTGTLLPGTSCMQDALDEPTNKVATKLSWTGTTFTFTKTGPTSAILNAEVAATYTRVLTCVMPGNCVPCTTNCSGSCTIAISGPLKKTD